MKKLGGIIVAVLLVITIVLGSVALAIINSSDYSYYRTQYNSCSLGYSNCMSEARRAEYVIVREMYEDLADDYRGLMRKWESRMEEVEALHMVFGSLTVVFGIATVVAGVLVFRKKKGGGATAFAGAESTDPVLNTEQPSSQFNYTYTPGNTNDSNE
ncbi:MAG: hypothetical protein IJD22_02950 [Clostridia bacterium]|nr:hypothetical protein [Clostridia bacterium]